MNPTFERALWASTPALRCLAPLDAFSASLERSAAKHPPSKARRIAALLPQIEAAEKASGVIGRPSMRDG